MSSLPLSFLDIFAPFATRTYLLWRPPTASSYQKRQCVGAVCGAFSEASLQGDGSCEMRKDRNMVLDRDAWALASPHPRLEPRLHGSNIFERLGDAVLTNG
jgi:hypothetical protein